MTTLILEPPCAFVNANDRLHHHAKARLTKAWREAASNAVLASTSAHRPPFTKAHVTVAIRFANNVRRDVGNYYPTAKAILDGLVDAGILPDDNDQHVIGPDMRRELPNGPLRVTVRIAEVAA